MSVSNGAQVAAGERLVLWDDATLDVWGGRLDVGGLATVAAPGEVLVHTSGLIGGTGTLQGSMKLGGTLDPGGAHGASGVSAYLKSVGYIFGPARQFRIEGALTVTETATLTFDIAGPATSGSGEGYDSVSIVGEAFLDGALRVSVVDDMVSQIASFDVFTILIAGGGLGGVFANVASGGQVAALGEDGVATEGFFQVFYGDGSPFDANAIVLTGFVAVPEPATLLLVVGGLLALAQSQRKTRPGDATARCCSIE